MINFIENTIGETDELVAEREKVFSEVQKYLDVLHVDNERNPEGSNYECIVCYLDDDGFCVALSYNSDDEVWRCDYVDDNAETLFTFLPIGSSEFVADQIHNLIYAVSTH